MPRATGVDTRISRYEDAWEAINRLIRTGGSWSGFERNCFYQGGADGGFANLSAASGLDFIEDGRGVAVWDYDRDGDPDLVLKNRNGPQVRVLRNDSQSPHGRISVRLDGRESNRQGIGARVVVEVGGSTRVKEVRAGSGFLSQSSRELFFGVGAARTIDRLTVRWPNGGTQRFDSLAVGHAYRVTEGVAEISRAPFRPRAVSDGAPVHGSTQNRREKTPRRLWLLDPAPLPRLDATDLSGREWNWRPYTRAPFVLNIWSPDCSRCVRELVEWQESRAGDEEAIPVVAVMARPADSERDQLDRISRRVSTPIALVDRSSLLALSLQIQDVAWWPRRLSLPCSLLIDGRGAIVRLYEGVVGWRDLAADATRIPGDLVGRQRVGLPFPGIYHASEVHRGYFQLGVSYMEAGLPRHALDNFGHAIARRPGDVESYYNSGLVFLELDDLPNARRSFMSALQGHPEFVDAVVNLGVVAAREGRIEEAGARFEKVLKLRPGHVEALMNLGNVELARARPRRALERFLQAVKREPGMATIHKRMGTAHRQLRDSRAARAAYEKAVELDPEDAEAWSNLGVILAESGEFEAGRKACETAVTVEPRYASAHNNLGLILGALGRTREALAAFRKAIELDRLGPPSYLNLARELVRARDVAAAKEVLEDLLEIAPDHPRALALLRSLGSE